MSQGSQTPHNESNARKMSRRRFVRSGVGGFSAALTLPYSLLSRVGFAAQANQPASGAARRAPSTDTPEEAASPRGSGKSWTPLNRALERFYNHQDRFACERRMRSLAGPLSRLQQAILQAGTGLEACLATDFQGQPLVPAREKTLRSDRCFEVQLALWDEHDASAPPLRRAPFGNAVRAWLSARSPLRVADLECLAIAESPRTATASPNPTANLLTRIRFELAGDQARPSEHDSRARWQATGEWEIEWQPSPASGHLTTNDSEADTSGWAIASWQPVAMTSVWAVPDVFRDVTVDAFGRDPSFESHLLRDTNYWRAVLDEASGIDIFGNSGVSAGDADGDGQDEIYLCQPQGLPNRLYRQVRPGVFEDVAASAGVDLLDPTSMALFADVLNRGHQDLVLITESSPLLFLNDGHGHFTLSRGAFPGGGGQVSLTSAAFADYNNDGYLDLYVCAYAYFSGQGISGIPVPYYDAHNGPPNRLYRNRGDGTFEDATAASGLNHGNDRFSFACAWCDIDDDGWPDLAVVNDFGRNNLYHNRGDGTFEEIPNGLPGHGAGMSATFLDAGRAPDLYVGNMWQPAGMRVTADPEFQQRFADLAPDVRQFAMGNALYERREASPAAQGYSLVPSAAGSDRARWAWCCDGFDLENDGYLDLYAVNGFLSSPNPQRDPVDAYLWQEIIALSPHSAGVLDSEYRAAWNAGFELAHHGHPWNGNERNVFFLNLGVTHTEDGTRFVDASASSALDFIDDGRAFAVFDYDGDGDADLAVHSRTGPQLRLLRNDIAALNHSLTIRLRGTTGNRDAIGARVEFVTPAGKQTRYLSGGSGFLAQHSKELVLGLGDHTTASSLRVRWPGGRTSEYQNLEAGYRYFLVEGEPIPRRQPLKSGTHEMKAQAGTLVAEAVPARFSTTLVDPLSVPWLKPLTEIIQARRGGAAHSPYALLWLWTPGDHSGLDTFRGIEGQVPGCLVRWDTTPAVSEALFKTLQSASWQADARFRRFASTLLAYLYDHRREPALPTGLLFELPRDGSAQLAATGGSTSSRPRLVKIYWGGAEAEEIRRDVRLGITTGAAALPFPGSSVLVSFRRDPRELGGALATAQLYAEAEVYLADAAVMHPTDPDTLYNLALVERENGEAGRALANVRAALSLRPAFPEAENLCGVLLSQSGQAAEARAYLEHATREAPNLVEAWNNFGYVLLLEGNLASSRRALERALELAPDFPDALDNLGIVAARQGQAEEAQRLFERALALVPGNPQAGNNLGVLYAKQGRSDLALRTLEGVRDRNPDDAATLLNLARLNVALHRTEEARRLLQSWLERHPGDGPATKLAREIDSRH